MKDTKPGESVVIDYRRKNSPAGVATIILGSNPDRGHGYLGVGVLDAPWAPFTIDFNLANIGGPSAGLMFSLAVVDKLTTGDLNGSKFVAGTGTITSDGEVGSIGGIAHKMLSAREAGATVFLVRPTTATRQSRARGRPGPGQGRQPGADDRRVEHAFRWWRTSPLLSRCRAPDA